MISKNDFLHPIVIFTYYIFIITFSCVFMHPIAITISLISGLVLCGAKQIRSLPVVLIIAVLNPFFNHEGATILTYLPNDNPITLEAIIYGGASSVMFWSVICHFSALSEVMTSDKTVYLLGKVSPALAMIFSMILRLVPSFKVRFGEISTAHRGIDNALKDGGIISKTKQSLKIIFVMTQRSLEEAVDTADSMKSRGYGTKKRSSYSNFKFRKRDALSIIYISALSGYIIYRATVGKFYFYYFPLLDGTGGTDIFSAYALLFSYPFLIKASEVIKWKKLK